MVGLGRYHVSHFLNNIVRFRAQFEVLLLFLLSLLLTLQLWGLASRCSHLVCHWIETIRGFRICIYIVRRTSIGLLNFNVLNGCGIRIRLSEGLICTRNERVHNHVDTVADRHIRVCVSSVMDCIFLKQRSVIALGVFVRPTPCR